MSTLHGGFSATLFVAILLGGPPLAVSVEAKVIISNRDCLRLCRHQARSDVAVIPGVDACSNRVTGASVPVNRELKPPQELSFKLRIDIAQKYGLDAKGPTANMAVGK